MTADRSGEHPGRPGVRPEVVGALLVLVGVFLALAVYLSVTGPLGRALDTLLGWVFGLGRFVLPVLVAAIGVLLIRSRRTPLQTGAIVGWGLCSLAVLGAVHLLRGPSGVGAIGDYRNAGGVVGAVVSEPLRQLAGSIGAALVLVALIVGGLGLATRTSLGAMARATMRGLGRVVRSLGRGLRDVSTLRSDRPDVGSVAGEPQPSGAALRTVQPYDFHAEDPDPEPDPRTTTSARRESASRAGSRDDGQAGRRTRQRSGQQSGSWSLPSPALLERSGAQTVDRTQIAERGTVLQESLSQHGVETTLVGATVGPTVTRYELELGPGVKVARITSLQRDIAYAMAATDVRILAPIPGRSAIGVEVPNRDRQLVALGDLLAAPEASAAAHPLDVAIGKDIAGRAVFLDLASTPHLLIAGATGAGKSSGLNCIITSLLMRTTPEQVRLILIDPKQVEMGQYQRLPHLLTQPVTDPRKAANALGWAVKEMERRYGLLSAAGVRDITGYNEAVDSGRLVAEPPLSGAAPMPRPTDPEAGDAAAGTGGEAEPTDGPERLSYIVVVVDELNDLMMVAARDVEESITRIAQKARAVGIHLIIATQRPSVNVITGVIKANVPARIAFAVSSLTDSRVILDQPGAEKLVGRGDMLLMLPTSSEIHRIQGSFVSEAEVREVVAHWTAQLPEPVASSSPGPVEAHLAPDAVTSSANALVADDDDEDSAMMRQAMELVVRSQLGSTSMLQRKLKVGFARAGRIMDLLEQRGVVGPSEGSKAREVLMTVEEFELLQQHGG